MKEFINLDYKTPDNSELSNTNFEDIDQNKEFIDGIEKFITKLNYAFENEKDLNDPSLVNLDDFKKNIKKINAALSQSERALNKLDLTIQAAVSINDDIEERLERLIDYYRKIVNLAIELYDQSVKLEKNYSIKQFPNKDTIIDLIDNEIDLAAINHSDFEARADMLREIISQKV